MFSNKQPFNNIDSVLQTAGYGFDTMGNYGQTGQNLLGSFGGINERSWSDKMFGLDGGNNLVQPILGTLQGAGNLFMGMQQYGLAKEALAMNKERFERNWNAQKQTTNLALRDRQEARFASNSSFYEKPDEYMSKYGVA